MSPIDPVHVESLSARDLRYLLACIDEGRLTTAARRLHVAQPTLSHALARLERTLGARLLERPADRRQRLRPTAAGRAVAERARRILAELAAIPGDLAGGRDRLCGELRLASMQSLNASLLPEPLAAFARAHPGVRLSVRTLHADEVPPAVREGRADLGLAAGAPDAGFAGLAARTILREGFVAIMPRGHALARRTRLASAALAGLPLLVPPTDGATGAAVARALREAGVAGPPLLELESAEGLRALVRARLGIALLPRSAAGTGERGLIAIPLESPALRRDVVALTRGVPGAITAAFIAALAARR